MSNTPRTSQFDSPRPRLATTGIDSHISDDAIDLMEAARDHASQVVPDHPDQLELDLAMPRLPDPDPPDVQAASTRVVPGSADWTPVRRITRGSGANAHAPPHPWWLIWVPLEMLENLAKSLKSNPGGEAGVHAKMRAHIVEVTHTALVLLGAAALLYGAFHLFFDPSPIIHAMKTGIVDAVNLVLRTWESTPVQSKALGIGGSAVGATGIAYWRHRHRGLADRDS